MATLTRETTSFKNRADQQYATFKSSTEDLELQFKDGQISDSVYNALKRDLDDASKLLDDVMRIADHADMLTPEEFDELSSAADETFLSIAATLSYATGILNDPVGAMENIEGYDEEG